MDISINTRVMTNEDMEAQILRAIMFAIFTEEYLPKISAEDFQKKFGTRGTECLAKYTAPPTRY